MCSLHFMRVKQYLDQGQFIKDFYKYYNYSVLNHQLSPVLLAIIHFLWADSSRGRGITSKEKIRLPWDPSCCFKRSGGSSVFDNIRDFPQMKINRALLKPQLSSSDLEVIMQSWRGGSVVNNQVQSPAFIRWLTKPVTSIPGHPRSSSGCREHLHMCAYGPTQHIRIRKRFKRIF